MPALPFDPVGLAPVLPDVIWAIGIALVLAIVTSRPSNVIETPTAMSDEVIEATIIEDDDGS